MPPRAPARPSRVVAIVGGKAFDSFRAERALEEAVKAALGAAAEDAVEVYRGDETSWNRVLDACRMGSLFAARRAVVVKNADALKGEADGLPAFLDDPPPDATLIVVAAKPDRRKTAWKALLDRAAVTVVEPLKEAGVRRELGSELARRGLRLDGPGQQELVDRVGQDLRRLFGELDKLEAYAGGRRDLSADDVAAVLGRGIAGPLYKVSDAIVERDAEKALRLIEDLLEEGEAGLKIVSTVQRAVRQMWAALAVRRGRVPPAEAGRALGLPPNMAFKAPDLLRAAQAWSERDVEQALRAVSVADRRLKWGGDERVALAAVVLACCPARATARRGAR